MAENYFLRTISLFIGMLFMTVTLQAQIFVNASAPGGGNGLTWATAYNNLQDALSDACPAVGSVEIWVAAGTYYPTSNSLDRNATFQLCNNVALYGGFAGTETLLSERNWVTNQTILSGDINQSGTLAGNSYNVVTGSGTDNTALIDGFTIIMGNADGGAFPNDIGGGMLNDAGSPTVINSTFSGNSATSGGGGMMNQLNSSPTVTNCSFLGNAAGYFGGGMVNLLNSSPMVTNCTFSGNSATSGGGMVNYSNSSPMVTNCTFSGNSAGDWGGGMYNFFDSSPSITNCSFSGNTATSGGGMFNDQFSSTTVTNSIIWGNSSGIHWVSAPIVSYSIVQDGLYPGTGNLNADPLFIDQPPVGLGTGGNLRLQPGSPAINAGNNAANSTTTDLDGNPRIQNGNIDMGAFESLPPIPTMGEWGLIILALLMLQGIWLTLVFKPGNVLRDIPALWLQGLLAGLQDKNILFIIAISGLFVFFGIAVFGSPQAADIVGLPLTLLITVPAVYWYRNSASGTLKSAV